MGPGDSARHALEGQGIRAGDEHEIGIAGCVAGGPELVGHLGGRDNSLVVVMAAPLRELLVLEMEGSHPGALESADHALDIEGVAVARVSVGDDGQG
jgi:hypothetical protein